VGCIQGETGRAESERGIKMIKRDGVHSTVRWVKTTRVPMDDSLIGASMTGKTRWRWWSQRWKRTLLLVFVSPHKPKHRCAQTELPHRWLSSGASHAHRHRWDGAGGGRQHDAIRRVSRLWPFDDGTVPLGTQFTRCDIRARHLQTTAWWCNVVR